MILKNSTIDAISTFVDTCLYNDPDLIDMNVDEFYSFCEQLKNNDPSEWASLASHKRFKKDKIVSFVDDYDQFVLAQSDKQANLLYCLSSFTIPCLTILVDNEPSKKFNDRIESRYQRELRELRHPEQHTTHQGAREFNVGEHHYKWTL